MHKKILMLLLVSIWAMPAFAQTPQIVSTSPTQNELNVPVSTNISVTFDIDMDETTINDSTFVVNARSTGLHEGMIIYDGPSRTATFDPLQDFDEGEVVTVVLTTGIQSSGGAPLDSSYIWSFTTEVNDESPGTFAPDSVYPVGDGPISVFAADLDGDGDLDLAIANNPSHNVSVLLNNGDGTFAPDSVYSVSGRPYSLFAGDLDGDGDLDLATANMDSDNISVLLNNGDGTFAPCSVHLVGVDPRSIFAADVDGDGDLDLANANDGSHNVSVQLNYGDGTFAPHSVYPVSTTPYSVFAADLDGDGDLDLATASSYVDNVSVLLNNGDGTFAPHSVYPVGDHPYSVFSADLDADGDLDLATANYESGDVSILLNNGDATFASHSVYPVGDHPSSVFAADLDGDGDLDLVTTNKYSNNVSVLLNNGDGTFAPHSVYPAGGFPASVFAADLDEDGDLDLATANKGSNNVSVLLNDGDGTFAPHSVYPVVDGPLSIFVTDLDGDGDLDLATANVYSDNVSVLLNNGDGTFASHSVYPVDDSPRSVFAADLDGDGDLDLAVANASPDNVSVLDNLSRGVLVTPGYDTSGGARTDVEVKFYIQNTGPVSDVYDVSVGDSLGWNIDPLYYEVILDTGQVDSISCTVSIPNVPIGTTNRIFVTAVSQTYPSVRDSASLTVTCNAYNVQIAAISDIGNDQGKQVRVEWTSFPGSDPVVTDFTIFRRIDPLLFALPTHNPGFFFGKDYPPGEWDMIGTYEAFGETLYSAVVPTLKDSTISEGMYWSVFFIRAGTDNPVLYFDSPVDSGYSLDNLSPSPPTGLLASHEPAVTMLTWSATQALDFDYYTVYRDTLSGFTPDPSNRLSFTIDTFFVDSTAELGKTYYYLASATDFSGNESDASNEAMGVRYITGDASGDGIIELGDVVYIINYVFRGGDPPNPIEAGDCNCDGVVELGDIVYLINYIFRGGPPPGCP